MNAPASPSALPPEKLPAALRDELDRADVAGWVLRTSLSGCALVRGGHIVVMNPAFRRLDRAKAKEAWCVLGAPERSYPTLQKLVLEETARWQRRGQGNDARLECIRGGEHHEVTFDRALAGPRRRAVLVVVRDVTGLTRMRAALALSQELLLRQERLRATGELALGIAHDVNNLLGAMHMRVGLLERDDVCRAAQGPNIEALRKIIEDGTMLVGKLQGLGRPQRRRQARLLDLGEIARDALEIARSGLQLRARERGLRLDIDERIGKVPQVLADPHELRHVFVNLLLNARDVMPAGGRIVISSVVTPQYVIIRFEDEGPGIPSGYLDRIFEPFFTTKGDAGHGLGLAMARTVMQGIGGNITARNRPSGGACFELRFRRTTARDRAPAESLNNIPDPRPTANA